MRNSFAFILTLAVFTVVAGQAGARKAGEKPVEYVQIKKNSAAASGSATKATNKQRFDPYKNYKFR
jgi:hypothetical protein